jgi:hypothetical protein
LAVVEAQELTQIYQELMVDLAEAAALAGHLVQDLVKAEDLQLKHLLLDLLVMEMLEVEVLIIHPHHSMLLAEAAELVELGKHIQVLVAPMVLEVLA